MTRTLLDTFFKDKKGRIVLWQNPNVPLWAWIVSMLLTHVLPYGQLNFAASLISFGALFTWSYLEITKGVNGFRRSVGLLVLVWSIMSRL